MNMKKYLLLLIILIMLINITSISATENNTITLEQNHNNNINITDEISDSNVNQDKISQGTLTTYNEDTVQSNNTNNKINQELLTTSPSDDTLELNGNETTLSAMGPPDSNYWPVSMCNVQFSLEINDTSLVNATNKITFNIHLEWDLYMHQSVYNDAKILVYENETILHIFQMSDLSGEYSHNAHDIKDITFTCPIKDRTEIKAILDAGGSKFESPLIFSFEELKNVAITNLKNNSMIINNNNFSNENWTNQLRYLKKAIEEAPDNSVIYLNNIELLNDENITINIDKNLTIIGNNAIINGLDCGTIFTINPQTTLKLISLTFINAMTNYIIKNDGTLKIKDTTFRNNVGRLISNSGDLTLENCKIENITSKYYALSFSEIEETRENGLIYNAKMLTLINTTFNNITLHPFTVNNKKIKWDGVIVNNNKTIIIDSQFTNINYRLIYNNGVIEINNTLIENSASSITSYIYQYSEKLNDNVSYFAYSTEKTSIEGGSVYNNNQCEITNITFQNIRIYNKNRLTIKNIISGSNGLMINNNRSILIKNSTVQSTITNTGSFTLENTTIQGSITNNDNFTVKDATLTQTSITNNGNMIINNTVITGNSAITNNGILTVTHSQIINNNAGASLIVNSGTGNFILEKTIIKKNTITQGQTSSGESAYYGVIRNNGVMTVTGCVFDNNTARDWKEDRGNAFGSICIYNAGKITVTYNYLLNVNYYKSEIHDVPYVVHTPVCFLYNDINRECNINYNFFCLSPTSVVRQASVNYYFIPSFNDYIPVKLNENTNITLTLGLTNGKDKIDFEDWDKLLTPGLNATITTLDENGEYFNITLLLKDFYTFNFNYTSIKGEYPIYANILNYKNDAVVDVGKEFADMEVNYTNITYHEGNMTFHVKVTGNLTVQPTGNLTFTLNNQKYNMNLTDGECNFTIPLDLKPDNYRIRIDYNGDEEYFKILRKYCYFSIFKIPTSVNITAPEVKYGQTGTITITLLPKDAPLYGTVYVDGKAVKEHLAIIDTITQTITRGAGTYNITIVIDEDEYYTGCSASTLFIVSKWATNLTVEADDIKAGENATINITVSPGDVRGKAILEINGKNDTIFLENTLTQITVTNLEEGTCYVTVYYPGDRFKYLPSNASTTFTVGRISSKLNVTITQNTNLTGNIKIQADPLNCTGEVIIYVNNEKTTLNLTNGKTTAQIKLKRGSNYIYVYYTGDGNYTPCDWNTTFNIEGIPVLTLETQNLASDKTGYVRVNLTDTNNIPYEYTNITIEFQNKNTTLTTDENGTVYFQINTKAGIYEITAYYENATITKNITVKTLTTLTVSIQSINEADDLMVYATLTDSNNNKITADVILEINGNYYKIVITNGAGSRNLGSFKHGTYSYTAIYKGDTLIYSANATGSFQVKTNSYKITGNKNIVQYYGATKTYKIRLLNNNQPVKGEIITVKIGKNTVKVKTNNQGYATLKLNLKAGKYTITSTCKNVKVSNKITVKPTLITKNKKIKKGKTLTYTAKLLNKNGKALKNKKITFKIKGKKYKAKTNKKGVAKIKVKNLKKGKYKIITTYGKQKNTNTITVK